MSTIIIISPPPPPPPPPEQKVAKRAEVSREADAERATAYNEAFRALNEAFATGATVRVVDA